MIRIKKVTPKGKAYELTLEKGGSHTTIMVHQDVLMRHHLFDKKTLTEKERLEIEKENATTVLMQKAIELLSHKDHSVASMRRKLLRHGKSEAVNDTLETLVSLKYLDDERMLKRLVDDMMEFSLKGPRAIRDKAIKEGFSASTADSAIAAIDEDETRARLEKLIEKEMPRYRKDPAKKKTMKLVRLAVQNGYDVDLAKDTVAMHVNASKDEADEERLLEKRIETLRGKYDLDDYKSLTKLIQKLMREGFDYESIKHRLK